MLLAASTGIVGATVVTMGLLSLPTMLRCGYNPKLACGTICAAGTLGQIIPPSIVLVLLGDVISAAFQKSQLEMGIFSPRTISVGDLFAGAMLPGLMLVGIYILYQILIAIIRPNDSPALPKDAARADMTSWQIFAKTTHALLPPVVLIIAVLGSILAGIASPTEAAGVGAVGSIMLAGLRLDEKHGWSIYLAAFSLIAVLVLTSVMDLRVTRTDIPGRDMLGIALAGLLTAVVLWGILISLVRVWKRQILRDVVRSTAQVTSMVFVILIGAALFSLTFRGLGGEETIQQALTGMPGGVWGAIAIVMVIMFFLGFFLDFIEITFVVVPLVAPALFTLGVDPIWLGIMIAMNLQTSFLTPPFGFALFYLRGVAPSTIQTMQIYQGAAPFVLIQILALIILAFVPELATWLPLVIFGS
jgi:TRAP-type mannitol/chloroaromatic compound transport system permease large subunit